MFSYQGLWIKYIPVIHYRQGTNTLAEMICIRLHGFCLNLLSHLKLFNLKHLFHPCLWKTWVITHRIAGVTHVASCIHWSINLPNLENYLFIYYTSWDNSMEHGYSLPCEIGVRLADEQKPLTHHSLMLVHITRLTVSRKLISYHQLPLQHPLAHLFFTKRGLHVTCGCR